jgi:hypothetical protein
MSEKSQEELVFVGYTNGDQILYAASEGHGGQGSFYSDTKEDCYIPLYMLKSHVHRLETTSKMNVTLDKLNEARSKNA